MSFSFLLLSLIIGALLLYATKVLFTRNKANGPLPPGPSPKPIIGNISDLPPQGGKDWTYWLKHKDLYGPISSITVMGQTIVIVNESRIATELLSKRSALYSSRPNLVFASELVGWEHILAMQTYSDRFRAYRKAIQPYLGSETTVAQYNTLQETEAHRFLFRVLNDQARIAEHIQTEAGAVILKIAYGYTIEPHKRDPLVHIANQALEHFSIAGTPGTWLVDMIPALKYVPSWFPGASFKRIAREWKKNLENVADKPYDFVRRRRDAGKHEPSYLANLFKEEGYPVSGTEKELVAKWTAASLYTGGADTTVCAIEIFLLAMTIYPEVQRKAQDELDRVLGAGRLPKVADRASLPYIDAVVKEVLRWHPVAPMGIPHMAFTHDPEVYHDPMVFKPERFLSIDGREPEMDPHGIVFGFGRRICPGRILADNTVYLSVAQSLTVFNITKIVENGKEVDVKPEFQAGVISHPVPWKFDISPRTPAHEDLIRYCHKVGLLIATPIKDSFRLLTPQGSDDDGKPTLPLYKFGSCTVTHPFCPHCGVSCYYYGSEKTDEGKSVHFTRINAHTIDGRADGTQMENLKDIKTKYWDGKTNGWDKGVSEEPWEGGVW
ncbi:hypothetical protein N7510_009123 [Penicillium lagena]|uniref:uncharacterized protein n=1 Tax=Penicillium lagena TaxID=94218 RepID=UPI002540C0B6|nr:uncharacterized protein N7510_009123 [Penicillium lagena]KAJ5606342.1 hypothetical protein N7510_009123 [Penicillium lagena]